MSAPSPKKKHERKTPKRYDKVRFESSLFTGDFELPDMKHLGLDQMERLNSGDVTAIKELLRDAGTDPEDIEAIGGLDADELKTFVGDEWSGASVIPAPKSTD